MKIKEDILECNKKLQLVGELTKQLVGKTEQHYTEIHQLKICVNELVVVCKDLTESVLAIIKQQLGD